MPCKTPYTEVFSVDNWLKKPQRFRVNKEMIRPDKLDPGTSVKGLDYIDVPGNAKRDYKLTFNAHKEGQSTLKVSFWVKHFLCDYAFQGSKANSFNYSFHHFYHVYVG